MIGSVRRFLRPVMRRRATLALPVLGVLRQLFSLMPSRMAFAIIVLLGIFHPALNALPGRAFQPLVLARLRRDPGFRFSSRLTRLFPAAEQAALFRIGAYSELFDTSLRTGLHLRGGRPTIELALAYFEVGDFTRARSVAEVGFTLPAQAEEPRLAHLKALLEIADGRVQHAMPALDMAVRGLPTLYAPHHNSAARYAQSYLATPLDRQAGDAGRIYDAANFIGQRVTHVGRGDCGPAIYDLAFRAQAQLRRQEEPQLSPAARAFLRNIGKDWRDIRLLPQEWFTQIGHLGMLDIMFRMRELGWWTGEPLMLARAKTVANSAFFQLFEDRGPVLFGGGNIDQPVYDELFSLQRWAGMTFNAFEMPDGSVVPWQDAGALLMRLWREQGRGHPLRESYDRIFGADPTVQSTMASLKKKWGMKEDDWFVCIHMRDAAHYGELPGMGQTHRNARMENYLRAIRHITDQGGWVIKLGGPKSIKLPRMPRVFDYARSRDCSSIADLHLIRNSRFFIGTTSGLTNVAVSFGVPCALVNCITTDAQLWHDGVRFAMKRLRLRDGTLVSPGAMTSPPWRWRVFSAEIIARAGAYVEENSAELILETVKEVEALALGRRADYEARFPESDAIIDRWRRDLAFPHFYGDARPAIAGLTTTDN